MCISSRFQRTFFTFQCHSLTFPSFLPHTVLLHTPHCPVGILHLSLLLHHITICNTSISQDLFIERVTFKCQRSNVKSYISMHAYDNLIYLILSPPWSIITLLMTFIRWLLHLLSTLIHILSPITHQIVLIQTRMLLSKFQMLLFSNFRMLLMLLSTFHWHRMWRMGCNLSIDTYDVIDCCYLSNECCYQCC